MHAGGTAKGLPRGRYGRIVASVAAVLALVVGCSGGMVLDPAPGSVNEPRRIAVTRALADPATQLDGEDSVILALKSSQLFFDSAQVVVLADANEPAAITRAASIAIALGTPMLLTLPDGEHLTSGTTVGNLDSGSGTLNTELLRLGTRAVLTVGGVSLHQIDTTSLIIAPAPNKVAELSELVGVPLTAVPGPLPDAAVRAITELDTGEIFDAEDLDPGPSGYGSFPQVLIPERTPEATVITDDSRGHQAAVATARAAGAQAVVAPGDPASVTSVIAALSERPAAPVVAMSTHYTNSFELSHAVMAMRAGDELPAGAQRVFAVDGRPVRYVLADADTAGEDAPDDGPPVTEAIDRAATLAAGFHPADSSTVVPALSLDVGPGRWPQSPELKAWVEETATAGQLLLLGFTGKDGVLNDQVKRYREVLSAPHVGVTIDLTASTSAIDSGEINDLILLLRGIVRETNTPQRMLQLQVSGADQISNLPTLLGTTGEVAVVMTAAGQDTVPAQEAIWTDLRARDLPVAWGWAVVAATPEPAVEGEEAPPPVTPVPVPTQLNRLDAEPDVLTYP